ncbi:MAG: hypothetical protein HYX38_25655 [Rhodospirillales bacterium]|nr:hypothetical protein [Rhodospirillales bacterium]
MGGKRCLPIGETQHTWSATSISNRLSRCRFQRLRLRGQKMQPWVSGGNCNPVVTVFCSPQHSVLRARDLEKRGEVFVGGDEQGNG